MDLLKQTLIRGIIPFAIMTGISLIMVSQGMDGFQIKSTFITGLIVTSVAAASVIYDVEGWSLLKQSAVHFLIMLATVLPCLVASGWFALETPADFLKLFGIFIATGLVLWTVGYVIFGKLIKK